MSHNAAECETTGRSRDLALLPWGVMSEENYMRIIDLRGKKLTRAEMLEAMPRAEMGTNEATDLVQPILDDVLRPCVTSRRNSTIFVRRTCACRWKP